MLRADAMQHANGTGPTREQGHHPDDGAHRSARQRSPPPPAPVANKVVNAEPGSGVRKAVEKVTGVSRVRLLPPFAKQRFSTWFKKRPKVRIDQAPGQGRRCSRPASSSTRRPTSARTSSRSTSATASSARSPTSAGCCGAPWLHRGDVEEFTKVAEKNVKALAAEVRARATTSSCRSRRAATSSRRTTSTTSAVRDAELVAEHTYDAAEYLMKVHKGDDTSLDTDFTGDVPATITYHTPCHLEAQNIGLKSRDLMKLTGAKVKLVQQCSGIDGMWGLRAENEDISIPIAEKLGDEITKAGGDVVAGDCHLANTAIVEQTGREARCTRSR